MNILNISVLRISAARCGLFALFLLRWYQEQEPKVTVSEIILQYSQSLIVKPVVFNVSRSTDLVL